MGQKADIFDRIRDALCPIRAATILMIDGDALNINTDELYQCSLPIILHYL